MSKKFNINIFEYHDYREFLTHIFKELKTVHKISLRKLSSNINTTAANLSMIQKGRRKLNKELTEKLAKELMLNTQEKNYLKNLIILNDSDEIVEKYDAYRKMKRNYAYQSGHANSLESFKYLSNWYNVVIRELVSTMDFKWDPFYIQSRLPKKVSIQSIKIAMTFLEKNNFVQVTNNIAKIDKNLDCVGGIYKLSLAKFHDEMMKITVDSIYDVESDKRCILGHTIALSKKDFETATELLNNTLKKIQELGQDQTKDDVYHFVLSSVPVTK